MKIKSLVAPILAASLGISFSLYTLAEAQMQTLPPPATTKAAPPKKAPVSPTVASPRGDGGWTKHHEANVELAKKGPYNLYFLGDSITDGWHSQKKIWEPAFGGWNPANFGISGDRTQHVLWRLQNGEFENLKPQALVLMIGTNNAGDDSVENIAAGITAIVTEVHKQSPDTKVLLLAIFPRSPKATDPIRQKLKDINAIIAQLDNGKTIKYLDFGDKFLTEDGTLTKEMMNDFLHLTPKGYQIWADAITPTLTEWLGAPAVPTPAASTTTPDK